MSYPSYYLEGALVRSAGDSICIWDTVVGERTTILLEDCQSLMVLASETCILIDMGRYLASGSIIQGLCFIFVTKLDICEKCAFRYVPWYPGQFG